MEALDIETRKKPGEITRDFRMLPSADYIRDLLEEDAEKLADKIKKFLFDNVEKGRGKASTTCDIPDLYRVATVKKLHIWAGLHGYKCTVDANNIEIQLKGLNHKRTNACSRCGKRSQAWTRFALGLLGVTTSMGSSIAAVQFIGSNGWSVLTIAGGIALSIASCLYASEWKS